MEKLAFTIEEVTEAAGIGKTKIYESINSGSLKARKFGKKTLICRQDLEDFLNGLAPFETKDKKGD